MSSNMVTERKFTTVEVPVLIDSDLPSLPFLQESFTFLEDVLFVSSEETRPDILRIYKQAEKFLLKRLYEYEANMPCSDEQDKRIHLYKERSNKHVV